MKEVDKNYCMNSFLQFRFVFNENKIFKEGLEPNYVKPNPKYKIKNKAEMEQAIEDYFSKNVDDKTALMLSSGIDSALLANYMPKGGKAFTLKCLASKPTTDETPEAKKIADFNGLEHEIVEVTWEDYEKYCDTLLKHKRAPFHSIEVQIYKAALRAKEQGYTKLLFGESADCIFGGLDGLLSKDWDFNEFVERYNYVPTKKVLKDANYVLEPYEDCRIGNKADAYKFISTYLYWEAVNSYTNACNAAGIEFLSPFKEMILDTPIDLKRIRNGESKYLIRELFREKYPDFKMNPKIPMPRPMELWLENWSGPKRKEFLPDCIKDLKGDAKWLVFILEKFLNTFNIED